MKRSGINNLWSIDIPDPAASTEIASPRPSAIIRLENRSAKSAAAPSTNKGTSAMSALNNSAVQSAIATDAVHADRARRAAILQSPQAAGQPKFAEYIASQTDLSVDQAIGCMIANAKDCAVQNASQPNPFSQFMDANAPCGVGASLGMGNRGAGNSDDDDGQDVAKVCRDIGLKGFSPRPGNGA